MSQRARNSNPRGRPVSELVNRTLIKAALDEFMEHGYKDMSMEAIAKRAGVSKVSLYRRWNSKAAVVTEVLRFLSESAPPIEDLGSFSASVRALFLHAVDSRTSKSFARMVLRMLGEISINKELTAAYSKHILLPRLSRLRELVEKGRSHNEIALNISTDMICAMIAGPLLLHYITIVVGIKTDAPEHVLEQLLNQILIKKSTRKDSSTRSKSTSKKLKIVKA